MVRNYRSTSIAYNLPRNATEGCWNGVLADLQPLVVRRFGAELSPSSSSADAKRSFAASNTNSLLAARRRSFDIRSGLIRTLISTSIPRVQDAFATFVNTRVDCANSALPTRQHPVILSAIHTAAIVNATCPAATEIQNKTSLRALIAKDSNSYPSRGGPLSLVPANTIRQTSSDPAGTRSTPPAGPPVLAVQRGSGYGENSVCDVVVAYVWGRCSWEYLNRSCSMARRKSNDTTVASRQKCRARSNSLNAPSTFGISRRPSSPASQGSISERRSACSQGRRKSPGASCASSSTTCSSQFECTALVNAACPQDRWLAGNGRALRRASEPASVMHSGEGLAGYKRRLPQTSALGVTGRRDGYPNPQGPLPKGGEGMRASASERWCSLAHKVIGLCDRRDETPHQPPAPYSRGARKCAPHRLSAAPAIDRQSRAANYLGAVAERPDKQRVICARQVRTRVTQGFLWRSA